MPKLHEILAVEGPAKQQADATRGQLAVTFEKKRHLFGEKLVTFNSNEEGQKVVVEDQSSIESSIRQELDWIAGIWTKAIDAAYQIAESNMIAKADIVLDDALGTILLKDVPATAILELEKRANEMFTLAKAIPTLDPAKGFALDASKPAGTYVAREEMKTRTKKIQRPLTLAPATDKHPAQVQLISEDVAIGTVKTQEWSTMITPAEKADMLDRIEMLRRALKAARSRANDVTASTNKIGKTMFEYVFATKRV